METKLARVNTYTEKDDEFHRIACVLVSMLNSGVFRMMLLLTVSISIVKIISLQDATATTAMFSLQNNDTMGELSVAEPARGVSVTMTVEQSDKGNISREEFLSIHGAQSGAFSRVGVTAYTLELDTVVNSTILFSDRPDWTVYSISTSGHVGSWAQGEPWIC